MTQYTEEGSEKKEEEKKSKEIKKEEPVPAADETSGAMIKLQRKQSQMEEQEKELKEKAQAQARKQLKDKDYYVYKLVGVLVHSGNAEAGHYYSYINVARHESEDSPSYLKTEADRWLEFNDSNISEFGFSRVESECFGGSQEEILTGYMEDSSEVAKLIGGRSKSAYMLIYERKNKGLIPLKESVAKPGENDIVLSSLECDGTAVSRAEKEGRRVFGKDPANNELYTFHRFHRVPAIVPPELLSVSFRSCSLCWSVGGDNGQREVFVRKAGLQQGVHKLPVRDLFQCANRLRMHIPAATSEFTTSPAVQRRRSLLFRYRGPR